MSVLGDARRRSRLSQFAKACTRVGTDVRLDGTPTVATMQQGRIEIGDRFTLSSSPVPSHLVSSGILRIGDDAAIGHGAAIAAMLSVSIGDRFRAAPFLVLMDTDFHGERAKPGARPTTSTAVGPDSGYAPVVIGNDVSLGSHVTILRGATIGDGATIMAGSVVNGRIPAGAVAGGVPARVNDAPALSAGLGPDVAQVAARVFGLPAVPDAHQGPNEISEWDSLGALKLLLALEETFGLSLDAGVMAGAQTIGAVQAVVDGARRQAGAPAA